MKALVPLLFVVPLAPCHGPEAPAATGAPASAGVPWELSSSGWRADPAWYDGKAEKCVYDAIRRIYGAERRSLATAYTNKQRMDPATTVKAAGATGSEVFKHHWSERVPTENYDYDFSTASFTRCADLTPFKLTVATQEDCGASFKQLWDTGSRLDWWQSVYFPDTGISSGELPRDLQPEDALTLVLRDFPFAEGARYELRVLPSQKDTHPVPFEPGRFAVRCAGRETLELPVGTVDAWRLELSDGSVEPRARYWFAADGSAPWLHALVRYEGPGGVSYRLRSIERTAYWERG